MLALWLGLGLPLVKFRLGCSLALLDMVRVRQQTRFFVEFRVQVLVVECSRVMF